MAPWPSGTRVGECLGPLALDATGTAPPLPSAAHSQFCIVGLFRGQFIDGPSMPILAGFHGQAARSNGESPIIGAY